MSETNTAGELRVAMRRLAELPSEDLRSVYQHECERERRFYTTQETEVAMLRYLLHRASEDGVRV